jgi:N-formylglutamate amidohydrolase
MIRFLLSIVWLAVSAGHAADLIPGNSVFGEHHYTEYIPGDLPVVIAAPHGGRLKPEEIPDRTQGVRESDANTQELARTVAAVIHARTGHHAHIVISHLHRGKLDPNREIVEAAEGNPIAEQAWREHHDFIAGACAAAVEKSGVAFFIDLHGHSHAIRRLELGYLHSVEDLAADDEALNAADLAAKGSLALIAARSHLPYADLLRGEHSLGALFGANGLPAAPSPSAPHPLLPYFRGGYTVARHCQAEKKVTGLQIECNRIGVRDTAENRLAFANALVKTLETFLPAQLGMTLKGESSLHEAIGQ